MRLTLVIALVALAFFLFLRQIERVALFIPSRTEAFTPVSFGLSFEDVYFTSSDGVKLHGWLIKADNARRNLIYCHGNAGNISDRAGKIKSFHAMGLNVFIFDYRGYGRSEGVPSEEGLYRDATSAFDWLSNRPDIGKFPIVVYGTSLGGAVAVDLASKRNAAALVADSTFASAKDMARIHFPAVPSFIIGADFNSARKIRSIKAPKLIIHSRTDEIVPFSQARKLFDAAPSPKEFLESTGGHNDNFFQSEALIREGLSRFLEKYGI